MTTIEQHPHGPHFCYCPECGYRELVEAGVKCNTLVCPECGEAMRAEETGVLRSEDIDDRRD